MSIIRDIRYDNRAGAPLIEIKICDANKPILYKNHQADRIAIYWNTNKIYVNTLLMQNNVLQSYQKVSVYTQEKVSIIECVIAVLREIETLK